MIEEAEVAIDDLDELIKRVIQGLESEVFSWLEGSWSFNNSYISGNTLYDITWTEFLTFELGHFVHDVAYTAIRRSGRNIGNAEIEDRNASGYIKINVNDSFFNVNSQERIVSSIRNEIDRLNDLEVVVADVVESIHLVDRAGEVMETFSIEFLSMDYFVIMSRFDGIGYDGNREFSRQ